MLLANISSRYFITEDERNCLRLVPEIVQSYPLTVYLFQLLGEDSPSLPTTQLVVSFYDLSSSGMNSKLVSYLSAQNTTAHSHTFQGEVCFRKHHWHCS